MPEQGASLCAGAGGVACGEDRSGFADAEIALRLGARSMSSVRPADLANDSDQPGEVDSSIALAHDPGNWLGHAQGVRW